MILASSVAQMLGVQVPSTGTVDGDFSLRAWQTKGRFCGFQHDRSVWGMKVTNLRLSHQRNFRDVKNRSFKRKCKVPLNKILESQKDSAQGSQEGYVIVRRILKAQVTRQNLQGRTLIMLLIFWIYTLLLLHNPYIHSQPHPPTLTHL